VGILGFRELRVAGYGPEKDRNIPTQAGLT
jgi:hypothetical protein